MSLPSIYDDIDRVLVTQEQLAAKISELGARISVDYAGKTPLLIGILKGCVVVMADLLRAISVPVTIDFMAVSSYGPATRSTGVVRIIKDLESSIEGRDVLVIEDIIDTGLTLSYILRILRERKPASLAVGTILNKPARRLIDVDITYEGIELPDEFVVGYGLDFADKYRNLPYIGVLKPEVYAPQV